MSFFFPSGCTHFVQACGCPVEGNRKRYIQLDTEASSDMIGAFTHPSLYALLPTVLDARCKVGFCHKHWVQLDKFLNKDRPPPGANVVLDLICAQYGLTPEILARKVEQLTRASSNFPGHYYAFRGLTVDESGRASLPGRAQLPASVKSTPLSTGTTTTTPKTTLPLVVKNKVKYKLRRSLVLEMPYAKRPKIKSDDFKWAVVELPGMNLSRQVELFRILQSGGAFDPDNKENEVEVDMEKLDERVKWEVFDFAYHGVTDNVARKWSVMESIKNYTV